LIELTQWLVGVNQHQIHASVAVVIELGTGASVGGRVGAREAGDIDEVAAVQVEEKAVALITAERGSRVQSGSDIV
jgi:hypothetical protein